MSDRHKPWSHSIPLSNLRTTPSLSHKDLETGTTSGSVVSILQSKYTADVNPLSALKQIRVVPLSIVLATLLSRHSL